MWGELFKGLVLRLLRTDLHFEANDASEPLLQGLDIVALIFGDKESSSQS